MRRHYTIGQCQDCGHTKRTTVVMFWVNAMKYRVCSRCIRAYRDRILTGSREALGYPTQPSPPGYFGLAVALARGTWRGEAK